MISTRNRLSEQDLAQLYLQTEAPLRLDDLLQDKAHGQAAQIAIHDSISGQTPDLALISLSLCGAVIARDYPLAQYGPVLRELRVAAENNLLSVGRLWLDSICHDIAPNPKIDRAVMESIPDRLRILTSVFLELYEALDDNEEFAIMHTALKTLYYQAESHADLAEKFVVELTRSLKKTKKLSRDIPDQIPLPFELTRPRQGAEVVAFSLFHRR